MAWQPTLAFLPGESQGQKGLAGYSPWDCEELDMTEQLTLLLAKLVLDKFRNLLEHHSFIFKIGKISIHRIVIKLS